VLHGRGLNDLYGSAGVGCRRDSDTLRAGRSELRGVALTTPRSNVEVVNEYSYTSTPPPPQPPPVGTIVKF
jgi:hypothetical protein